MDENAFAIEGVSLSRKMCLQRCGVEDRMQEMAEGDEENCQKNRKGSINPTQQWWVSETLVKDCEGAWLDTR